MHTANYTNKKTKTSICYYRLVNSHKNKLNHGWKKLCITSLFLFGQSFFMSQWKEHAVVTVFQEALPYKGSFQAKEIFRGRKWQKTSENLPFHESNGKTEPETNQRP